MKDIWGDYTIEKNADIYFAHWKIHKNKCLLVVLDEDEKFYGVVTKNDFNKTYTNDKYKCVYEIANTNCKVLKSDSSAIDKARSIFLDYNNINHIPVIDDNDKLVDIISREMAFWKKYLLEEKLPRMHYAYSMYMAAVEAKTLGIDRISVLEFGVAGGAGLMNCEFHAKALKNLLGIDIEIYGFDLGNGLPEENMGYKDMIHLFHAGDYKMDFDKLENNLSMAKLVLGNLKNTLKDFTANYNPAPVGCILVDVDYYSSTLPILEFLKGSNDFFLPRVYMYWDDVSPEYEFQGENLAIKEFNQANEEIKISPEKEYYQGYRAKIKMCHKFTHKLYNESSNLYVGVGSFRHDNPFFFHELPMTCRQI